MKKIIPISFILITLLCFIGYNTVACPEYPSYVSGPTDIEKNNATAPTSAGYPYVMNMSPGYKSSSGGYTNTEWTLNGVVVGYSENLNLSTVGSTLSFGNYTLTAKNQFGGSGSCFGCLTNTTFNYPVTLSPHRPDLIIAMTTPLPSSLNESPSTYQITYKITNNGTAVSPATNMKIYWTRETTAGTATFDSNSEPVPAGIASGGGTYTVQNVTMYTPAVLTTQEWTLRLFVDNYSGVVEQNEGNNIASYTKTINNTSKKIRLDKDGPNTNLLLVTDLSGNTIWKKGSDSFEFSKLKPGLYVFKTQEGSSIATEKVLKE